MKPILVFTITFIVFLLIDFLWLSVISGDLYKNNIGHLMSKNVQLLPALIFYAIFVVGLTVLVLIPGLESQDLTRTLLLAALFGLVTYATYDLTNLATLKDWPLKITLIDLAWGTTVSTLTTLISYLISNHIIK